MSERRGEPASGPWVVPWHRMAIPLAVLVAGTLMFAGTALRAPCVAGMFEGPGLPRFCGTQIPDLLFVEDLTGGRLPYLEECTPPSAGLPCDEYPVLTMYAMRLGAVFGTGHLGFFLANAAILTIAAGVAAWLLAGRVGLRALYLAAAPALLLYGLMNWDLVGVAFMVWGLTAFLSGRDEQAGIGVGLATATKLFPALLLVGMVVDRLRSGRRDRAVRLLVWSGLAWALVNLPFAAGAPGAWSFFYRFNSTRPPDIDSLWFIACDRGVGEAPCLPTTVVNMGSLLVFVLAAALVWRSVSRLDGFVPWTFGFPLLALFFLANKVYSPQYDLWLLPWFALVLPHLWLFVSFSVAEVLVFLTRYADLSAPPSQAFHLAVLARDAVLVLCVFVYARGWATLRRGRPRAATGWT